ncbi:hypothetical protein AVEN_44807-1 [Araneus ventricosus]|uniref:Uncharacterized protein n=1 Tax=Araneus ventricosus TaxID=182803 RepID=A0A4Y2P2E6_ARAVE|nr:hypothetical protein AVEN_44807-1 [Araneus ventricosus]
MKHPHFLCLSEGFYRETSSSGTSSSFLASYYSHQDVELHDSLQFTLECRVSWLPTIHTRMSSFLAPYHSHYDVELPGSLPLTLGCRASWLPTTHTRMSSFLAPYHSH